MRLSFTVVFGSHNISFNGINLSNCGGLISSGCQMPTELHTRFPPSTGWGGKIMGQNKNYSTHPWFNFTPLFQLCHLLPHCLLQVVQLGWGIRVVASSWQFLSANTLPCKHKTMVYVCLKNKSCCYGCSNLAMLSRIHVCISI